MEPTSDEYDQRQCAILNSLEGNLAGYDCPICRNKGIVNYVEDGYIQSRDCECMAIRRDLYRVKASGLQNLLEEYTFDTFQAKELWQQNLLRGAQAFLRDHNRKWFFIGGQVGVGKTHLCTAIVAQFLKEGVGARYMLWKDETTRLKAVVNDSEAYARLISPLKTVPVLYIDDLFKTPVDEFGNKKPPTQGDINIAFEVLNYRYNNDCVTILSSERVMDEILACDEAVGSRVYQRTKEYCFNLGQDRNKNYRLR